MGASRKEVLNANRQVWTWRTPRIRRALLPLALFCFVSAMALLGVSRLGYWLVVADPLEPARAIVVLGGRLPFRAIEAASIYRQGWAPEVWLTKVASTAEELALNRLGVTVVGGETYNRQILERLGVPAQAIRVLNDGVWNTLDETRLVAHELKVSGADRVILVTSKTHTRRARATWSATVGASPRAIIRYAGEEPYHPESWWRNTRDAFDVPREAFGLVNVWVGFPVQPDRRQR